MMLLLTEVLEYQHPLILARYTKDYPNNQWQAADSFIELKKYLWLCQQHQTDIACHPTEESLQFKCVMHHEMKEIDDMWHTFLLFTKDYMDFCQTFFGHYLHHYPTDPQDRPDKATFEKELGRYLSYTYDHLGEATLKKWFGALLVD